MGEGELVPRALARAEIKARSTGELFLSHTRLSGRYVIRLAIGNERTTEDDVRRAWDSLRAAAAG